MARISKVPSLAVWILGVLFRSATAVTFDLEENHAPIRNPLKGFRGQMSDAYFGSAAYTDQGIPDSQPIWDTPLDQNLESVRKVGLCYDPSPRFLAALIPNSRRETVEPVFSNFFLNFTSDSLTLWDQVVRALG